MSTLSHGSEPPGEAAFLTRVRQLTFDGRRSGEGYFSTDGKVLVLQSEREPDNPFYQIYLLELETGDTHRISPGSGKTTCAFLRPGSTEVLFASTHLDPNAGAKQKAEFEFRASGQRRLTDWPGYDGGPFFSPDGQRIIWRHFTADGRFADIQTMKVDGSDRRRLTDFKAMSWAPYFHPSSRYAIFTSNKLGFANFELYLVDAEGSREPVRKIARGRAAAVGREARFPATLRVQLRCQHPHQSKPVHLDRGQR